MKKYLPYFLFISLELSLFIVIIVLAVKIKSLSESKVKGVQYVTQIKKEDLIFDSENMKYFYEPKPNTIENWNRDWLSYEVKNTINSDSLNERYEYSLHKDKQVYRIITLGDSFTFGQYVNTNENYSEILEDLLNRDLKCNKITKFEVINLGVYGYDIEYEIERLIKRGIKYNPDLVIWLISNGNFMKINEKVSPLQRKIIEEGYKGEDAVTKRDRPLVEAISRIQNEFGNDYLINYQTSRFYKMSSVYGGKLLVLNHNKLTEDVREVINKFISMNNNFSFKENLFPYLEEMSYQLTDGHPNKDAHKKMAIDLSNYLIKAGILNCN